MVVRRRDTQPSKPRRRTRSVKIDKPIEEKQPKKIKLTVRERWLLEHPPTEKTWECTTCSYQAIRGGIDKCWMCGNLRSKDPKLLWPEYILACEKVKIEPGYMWKIVNFTPMMKKRGGKWEPVDI